MLRELEARYDNKMVTGSRPMPPPMVAAYLSDIGTEFAK